MIQIFHIISRLDVGGAERVAINISSTKREGFEHHIVEVYRGTSQYSLDICKELQEKGISYHRAILPILISWHYIFERMCAILFPIRFLFLWLRHRPEIIHCHTEIPEMSIWLAYSIFPFIDSKVIRTIHNTKLWTGMNFVGPRVERFMQKHNANIAISENVQRAYMQVYGESPKIINNGVAPTSQAKYNKLKEAKTNICFAGRFEEQKGIQVLCKIIQGLKDDDRYYFHIFGSGRLQYMVDELKGLPNVSVNDAINNIASYMASFDYIIMPSVHEGLSILALEASFNNVPLIINRCHGLTETLPEQWPLAVSDNDMAQWINLFRNIIPGIDYKTLQQQARAFVQKSFSLEAMQDKYIKEYTESVSKANH